MGNADDDYTKYKICDKDISIEIKFLRDYGDYKTGDKLVEGIFINSYGLIYRIDRKHKLSIIKGKLLKDFIIKEIGVNE